MLLTPPQARLLFEHALAQKYAVLAVNADSPAAVTDCLLAARQCDAPIIVETSLWQLCGHSFGATDPIRGLARYYFDLAVMANSSEFAQVPVAFHTDHIKGERTLEILTAAIEGVAVKLNGAQVRVSPSTISLDSSSLTEEQNLQTVMALCAASERAGRAVALEMEAGIDDGLTSADTVDRLLGPVERRYPGRLVLWAPGLGTRHGYSAQGYPAFSVEAVALHCQTAAGVCGRPVGLALHGSSGLAASSLRDAVSAGVVKVNWSTESLAIRSGAAARYYRDNAVKLDPTHAEFKATAMDTGVQEFVSGAYVPRVVERIRLLGGQGRASELMGHLAE